MTEMLHPEPTETATPEPTPTPSPSESPTPSPSPESTGTTSLTESCGTSTTPCYVIPDPISLDPLYIGLGLIVLLLAGVLAAQLRRP